MDLALKIKVVSCGGRASSNKTLPRPFRSPTNFVSMIERGKREPTLKYLKAFSRLVKIPLAVLLWEPPQEAEPGRG